MREIITLKSIKENRIKKVVAELLANNKKLNTPENINDIAEYAVELVEYSGFDVVEAIEHSISLIEMRYIDIDIEECDFEEFNMIPMAF